MKTFFQIVIFVVAAMALVQVLDEFIPMGRGLSWNWVLYLIGGATIFVIYTRRLKSKGPWEGKNDRVPEESVPAAPPEDSSFKLEQVRHRIRRRKTDLRSKK
jgi:hypothetical protein